MTTQEKAAAGQANSKKSKKRKYSDIAETDVSEQNKENVHPAKKLSASAKKSTTSAMKASTSGKGWAYAMARDAPSYDEQIEALSQSGARRKHGSANKR